MSIQPPLGGNAPPLVCNRILDWGPPERCCGELATWHVIWTMDTQNGLCCDRHAEEVRRRWVFVGFHPYTEICSMPGATWLPDEDRCIVNEELLGLSAVAELEAVR